MHIADRHRSSRRGYLDDFVDASSEHGDDDDVFDVEDDDLQLANVSEHQVDLDLPVRLLQPSHACSQMEVLQLLPYLTLASVVVCKRLCPGKS